MCTGHTRKGNGIAPQPMPRRTAPRSQSKSRSDAECISLDASSCLQPALWFAQVEGQFALANITADATKFYYVTAQLDHVYAAEVKDINIAPPETNKYEKLKTELTKRLSASREKEVQQLLMHEELGDRKPSQFLRHLAGPNIPEDFLKTIWTSRLPNSIQAVLAAQPTTPLATLAEVADRVNDIVPRTPVVASTSTSTQNTLDHMANMISELTKQVQALTTHASRKPRPMSRGRDERKRSSSRSHSSYRKYPICWYHAKFGTTAKKCVKPCNYSAGNAPGSR
ncbi:uncharacterized protein LOC124542620 [Vanessa cardui]|uniref:uncharacterized protein LOC124542620 n=1 Tax=Vanessa cardui TaxID=171605 RepID=UPI001F1452AC|nr:uncharacterized protein LOC124542620 [Vanessa cardui]